MTVVLTMLENIMDTQIYDFDIPQYLMEDFEERAAILEFDGKIDRARAERQAHTEIIQRIEQVKLSANSR